MLVTSGARQEAKPTKIAVPILAVVSLVSGTESVAFAKSIKAQAPI